MSWDDRPDLSSGDYPDGAQIEEILDKIEAHSQSAVSASSSAGGTGVTTTETKDASGDVIFTAVEGYDYQVTYTATSISGGAGAIVVVNIRDGGASSPTNASTNIAGTVAYMAASGFAGQAPVNVVRTLNCPTDISVGVHTIAAFYVRSGSGAATTVQLEVAGPNRQLSVQRIGG